MKTSKISPSSIVKRAVDLPFSRLDEEMLALDEKRGYFYTMNESAGRIWDLIRDPVPISSLCIQLCKEFEVDEKTCLEDLIQLLQSLRNTGLVEVRNGPRV